MTLRIVTSTISRTLDAFNDDVRHNHKRAHDSPSLSYEEALVIFNDVARSLGRPHRTPPDPFAPRRREKPAAYGCTGRRLFLKISVAIARPRMSPAS
jgi:hypothetical protein